MGREENEENKLDDTIAVLENEKAVVVVVVFVVQGVRRVFDGI